MTTKHTPGPWMISEEPDSDGTFFAIRSSRGFLIAATATYDLRKDRAANAQLIAAAPDLSEALQRLIKGIEESDLVKLEQEGPSAQETAAAFRIARHALAAAGVVS